MKRPTVFDTIKFGLIILLTLPLVIALTSDYRWWENHNTLSEPCAISQQPLTMPAPQYIKIDIPQQTPESEWAKRSRIQSTAEKSYDPTKAIRPKGTQVLFKSALSFGTQEITSYALTKINLRDCEYEGEMPDRKKLHHKLNSAVHNDSSLIVDFSFVSDCGSDFLCEVEYIDDHTLNLIYHQYNSLALCDCCYGVQYEFRILGYDQSEYADHPEIKYVMFNGENKTKIPAQH